MEKKRTFLLKFLIIFLLSMLAFSYLSRITKNVTIPKVFVTSVGSQTIEDAQSLQGVVKKEKVVPVFAQENQKIKAIDVRIGEKVKKGTPLFSVETSELSRQIKEKDQEIKKLEIGIANVAESHANEAKDRNLRITQAREMYQDTVKNENRLLKKATSELKAVEKALKSGSNLDKNALKKEVEEKQKAVEETQAQGQRAILQAKQALETAESSPLSPNESLVTQVDLEQAREAVRTLKELQKDKGIVRSKISGVVSKINIAIGELSTVNAVMQMEDEKANNLLILQVEKSEENYVKIGQTGDVVGFDNTGAQKLEKEAKVVEVKEDSSNPSMLEVKINLGQSNFAYQSRATFSVEISSQTFPYCVAADAVHEGARGPYVLVVDEKKSITGVQKIAKEVDVKILSRAPNFIAIVENVDLLEKQIIVELNKPIKSGDLVRIVEEETGDEES